jgi:hypothetical protein
LFDWHLRQAEQAEWSQQFFAARFHLREALSEKPDDLTLPKRLAELESRSIRNRDPNADATTVDLTDYYNAVLTQNWYAGGPGNDLSELPQGIQNLDGTPFDIRGLIQVTNGEMVELGRRFPNAVTGIRVNRKGTELHFLHAARRPNDANESETGSRLASYVIHFADGQTAEIPLVYGQDLANWWNLPVLPSAAVRARVAWKGQNALTRKSDCNLHLFKLTWHNPQPERAISTIDFIVSSEGAAVRRPWPFLIAITLE